MTKEIKRTRGFEVVKAYEDKGINLPRRQTLNSAGYDVESAEEIVVPSIWKTMITNITNFLTKGHEYENIKPTLVPTGIKAYMPEDEMVLLFNRSGNPLKHGLVLANGVGLGDADYHDNPKNEGHYYFAFYNFFPFDVSIKKGQRIGQAVFQKFLKCDNDEPVNKERNGGFNSTKE